MEMVRKAIYFLSLFKIPTQEKLYLFVEQNSSRTQWDARWLCVWIYDSALNFPSLLYIDCYMPQ